MKKIIAAAVVVTAVLCFSILPLSSEKGTVWCTYSTGSELQSDIQAERGVYFNAADFGLIYPVYLHDIGAYLSDEGYSYTYRVYDQSSDSLIYEGVFSDSSIIGNNIQNITEPLILNRNFTISMTPEATGFPRLGHSEQAVSEHSFYKTAGGNWEAFSSVEERYEWKIYAKMSNVNDYDAPEIISISGLENIKNTDAIITITVRDESAISQVYGEYDLGAGWVQFAMNATKADYIYSGTIPGQPADTSIPIRFYMKDEHANSGYSSTYTAKWTGGLPINVTISYLDSTVTLNWTKVNSANQYYIYGSIAPYGEYTLIDSTTSTNWSGNCLSSMKFYKVTVSVLDFIFVEGGTFMMGDHLSDGRLNELPLHSVTLSSFYIGTNEVTQKEWTQYMPAEDWSLYGTGDNHPAYALSWYEIIKYCSLRSIAEGLTPCYTINGSTDPANWGNYGPIWDAATCNWSANGYRLPTEAEWEYAARGGIHHTDNFRYSGCDLDQELTNFAWYISNNTPDGTKPVGGKLPNQLGIFDMSGNITEWSWDWWGSYTSDAQINPRGPAYSPYGRVSDRGGHWPSEASDHRVAYRGYRPPSVTYPHLGFRLARTP